MKNLYYFIAVIAIAACSTNSSNEGYLIRVAEAEYEFGNPFAYINQAGDTVVPYSKYALSFTDTIHHIGMVMQENGIILAIDANGNELYEVMNYDNGPDYPSDGLFRMIKNGKIGYADERTGAIIIEPKYACAFPFEEGTAKVSMHCSLNEQGEYSEWISEEWTYIDTKGNKVN